MLDLLQFLIGTVFKHLLSLKDMGIIKKGERQEQKTRLSHTSDNVLALYIIGNILQTLFF